jgi:tRNA-splicing ligase RtcB
MEKIISTENIPIKLWLKDIESGALNQAMNLANHPNAFHHIALMPDTHVGFGMPIGGVLATKDVIIPNAVGVDIGCGICAVRTSLREIPIETLKGIMGAIRRTIPVGFKHHKSKQYNQLLPDPSTYDKKGMPIVDKEFNSALCQIGTLGGGNHFIEVQHGNDSFIWLMVHSGSRNIGYKVARHYNKLAKSLNEKWKSQVPLKWDLAYLPLDSTQGQIYQKEMQYCVDFAFASRKLMMEKIKEAISYFFDDVIYDEMINIAHNYAEQERHFGKKVIVHRKGATLANKKTIGIIPGSQGMKSYIVKGKGNPESFESCSHGAGRRLGRRQAQRQLDLKSEQKALNEKGIIHSIRSRRDLDEAPSAYKDILIVMKNQEDLVEILVELEPLAVIKG